ncbi:MAG: glutamate racemase [Burkholderiales bacterium]|nr:glutamate racemase [Burkholderiales bacterium]
MKFSTENSDVMAPVRVGVFDSGVGGLSVLRALREQLPGAALHYVADAGHAPYGERSDDHVIARSRLVASHLIEGGAQFIVIACNTATAVAAQLLRETWPQTPIIGVEPGIKPASLVTRNGRIGVMATRATLGSEKFRRLAAALATGEALHLRACDGLAAAIEQGQFDNAEMLALVEQHCAPLREQGVDTVVLGCTHYTFVHQQIQAAMGTAVQLVDTAEAVARHAAYTVCKTRPDAGNATDEASMVTLQTTGDAARFQRFAHTWLGTRTAVSHIAL